jgi:hypothetical protein
VRVRPDARERRGRAVVLRDGDRELQIKHRVPPAARDDHRLARRLRRAAPRSGLRATARLLGHPPPRRAPCAASFLGENQRLCQAACPCRCAPGCTGTPSSAQRCAGRCTRARTAPEPSPTASHPIARRAGKDRHTVMTHQAPQKRPQCSPARRRRAPAPRAWMMSTGAALGQPGARVRGYTRANQLAASRSSPGSRGATSARGAPAPRV